MVPLLQFLEKYQIWVYLVLGGLGLIYLRRVLGGFQEYRSAQFGLERESAQRKLTGAVSMMVLVGFFLLAQFLLVSFVSPEIVSRQPLATPTLDVLATPTPTIAVAAIQDTEVVSLLPTIIPTLEQGCSPGQVEWTSPSSGEQLRGIVELKVVANIPNLGFYKFEYSTPGSNTWYTIAGGNRPQTVDSQETSQWNTSALLPGDYLLRLVVYDNQNTAYPACVIPIQILTPE